MKSLYKLTLSSGLTAIGLFGLQGSAMAVTATNANICQQSDPFTVPGLVRSNHGIFISGGGPSAPSHTVVCPIVRVGAATADGLSVLVDGVRGATAHDIAFCRMESYNFNDTLLGAVSFIVNSVGKFNRVLTLPQTQIPLFSSQVVSCFLPADSGLFNIEPLSP